MADDQENQNTVLRAPEPEKPQMPQDRLSTLRTYQADVQRVVRGDDISMASIALKERARALSRGEEPPAPPSTQNRIFLALSLLLLLTGLATISYFVFFRKTDTGPVVATTIQSLIFSEKDTVLDTTGLTTEVELRQIRRTLGETRTLGTIENIVFAKNVPGAEPDAEPLSMSLDSQEFFRFLTPRAPDALVRLLNPPYMYGIHGFDRNFGFLFLETDEQERVYSELLSWEGPAMARDLLPLIQEFPDIPEGGNVVFQDLLIKNIDARVLRNSNNEILLLYAFLTPKKFVITGGEDTFVEVLRRFTQPRPVTR